MDTRTQARIPSRARATAPRRLLYGEPLFCSDDSCSLGIGSTLCLTRRCCPTRRHRHRDGSRCGRILLGPCRCRSSVLARSRNPDASRVGRCHPRLPASSSTGHLRLTPTAGCRTGCNLDDGAWWRAHDPGIGRSCRLGCGDARTPTCVWTTARSHSDCHGSDGARGGLAPRRLGGRGHGHHRPAHRSRHPVLASSPGRRLAAIWAGVDNPEFGTYVSPNQPSRGRIFQSWAGISGGQGQRRSAGPLPSTNLRRQVGKSQTEPLRSDRASMDHPTFVLFDQKTPHVYVPHVARLTADG